MTPDQEKRLKLLEQEDLRRRSQVEEADLGTARKVARKARRATRKAARRHRWRKFWAWWVAFWEATGKHLKTAGFVVAGALGVAKGIVELADTAPGKWLGHKAHRMWSFYADRGAGEPDQPPPTGAPSTALDFTVTRARPPDGGEKP